MACSHQFTEISDLAFLQRLYSRRRTSYFAHHVARTFLGNRVGDSALHLFPIVFGQFGKELDRFYFADLLHCGLALTNAVVVCAAVQMVRTVGIGDHHFDAFQLNRHMLELQGIAVEVDSVIFLTLCGSELIHDTAHHTGIFVLASLTDKG